MADGITLARAFVEIIPTVKGIQGNIAQAMGPVERDADETGKKAGGRFSGAFGKAALGTGAIAGAGAVAVGVLGKAFYELGSVFDDVSDTIRVGTGASGEALTGLEDVAKSVATTVPASYDKIGQTVADLNTRLGLSGDTLDTVAQQYLNAGNILGEEVDVQKTTAAFSAFRIEGDQVVGAMDTLFQVSQATGVGMNDLAAQVQKNAPAMQNLGFSFEETAQMAGALDKAGLNSTQVLSSMSKGLVTLAKDGEEPAAAFDRVTGEIQRMVDAGDIAGATDLASKVFGTKGATQFVGAVQSGKVNMDDLRASVGATGDTINGLAQETADFPEQWQMFKNTAMQALEPVGTAVFGLAGQGMGMLTDGLRTVTDSFDGIKQVFATGDFDPTQWADGVTEDSPLVGFVFALRTGFEAVQPIITQVGDAFARIDWGQMGSLLQPFLDGVQLLVPALFDAWTNLSPLALIFDALKPSLPVLGEAFLKLAGTLGGMATTLLQALLPAVGQIVGALGPVLATVIEAVVPIITQVVDAFVPLVTMLAEMLAPILTLVAGLVSSLLQALLPLISTILGLVSTVLGPLLEAITAIVTPLIQLVSAILTPLIGLISAVLVPVIGVLADVLSVVANVIATVLSVALEWLTGAITWLVGVVSTAIPVIVTWFQDTLLPAITAAWDGIAAGATWLWQNVISPVWQGIQLAIGLVVDAVKLYVGAWVLFFQEVVAPVFRWLWQNVISPVWQGIQAAIGVVVAWWRDTAWPIISGVIESVKTGFGIMRDRISEVWNEVKDRIINPVATWFRDTLVPIFTTAKDTIVGAFETARDGIRLAWDAIKDIAKTPVDFVINTVVYNLAAAFDTVAGKFGADKLNFKKVAFADGGVMPGYTPGRDVHRFYSPTGGLLELSGGEPILRPEVGQVLGASWVHGVNAAARGGGIDGVRSYLGGGRQAFAGGGIWDKIKGFGGDAIDWVKDGAEFVGEALTDPKAALRKVVDALIGQVPGAGPFVDMAKRIPGVMADAIGDSLAGLFTSSDGGAVPAGGSGGSLGAAEAIATRMGLHVTSRGRRGARTAQNGLVSLHALGRAIDVAGPNMMGYFNAIDAAMSPTELLYSPAGARNKHRSGRRGPNTGATLRNHYSHVHVGFNQGGVFDLLPFLHDSGGWHEPGTMSLNMLREPEAILTPQQWGIADEAIARLSDGSQGGVHFHYEPTQVDLDGSVERRTRREFESMMDAARKVVPV